MLRIWGGGGQTLVGHRSRSAVRAFLVFMGIGTFFASHVPIVGAAQAQPANSQDQADEFPQTRIGDISIDVLALSRDDLRNVALTGRGINGGAPTPFISFSTNELDGDELTAGIRGTIRGRMLDHPVEFSAFALNPIEMQEIKLNLGQEPGNPANTNAIYDEENDPGADIDSTNSENIFGLDVYHRTQLFGAEVNALDTFGIPGLTVGVRGIYFGEELDTITLEEPDDVPGGSDTSPDRDQVTIRTDNHLFGLQAGLQGMVDISKNVSIGGSVKGGLYVNQVERRRTFRSQNVASRHQDNDIDDHVFAQAVEINPRIEVRLADGVSLTAAGMFLWLNNVSDAVSHYKNVTDTADQDIRADKDVFFYGGSLGLKIALDSGLFSASPEPSSSLAEAAATLPPITYDELDDRIAELEATTARKGNPRLNMQVRGVVNFGLLGYDDGVEENIHVVNFSSSRSRFEFRGNAKIARGWAAGYRLAIGINDDDSNDINQLSDDADPDDKGLSVRHSNWWLRYNRLGTMTVGFGSPATDNIILLDTGGIAPGTQNMATIGGSLYVRHADEHVDGDDAIITRTTLNDMTGGASVDTLRRNVVRYDTPRLEVLGGRLTLSTSWGEDDFFDAAAVYRLNYNDFRLRAGFGYLHDIDTPDGRTTSSRDREEYKGSASLIHVPSGIFATAAYVHREFHGFDPSNQAVFGENTTAIVTPPGTNRPDLDYLYVASGVRTNWTGLGDTSFYGEYGRVDDAITGLREAGLFEVTDSRVEMVGAAISQDIEAASMDVYAGVRRYSFNTEGVISEESPEPLTDLMLFFAGARVRF